MFSEIACAQTFQPKSPADKQCTIALNATHYATCTEATRTRQSKIPYSNSLYSRTLLNHLRKKRGQTKQNNDIEVRRNSRKRKPSLIDQQIHRI
jgi:hypothetical protein